MQNIESSGDIEWKDAEDIPDVDDWQDAVWFHAEDMVEPTRDEEFTLMNACPYAISFLTEFFCVAIQMFIGCLGSVYTFGTGPVISAFSFGLGRLTCYEIFNRICPVHVNPAKSLGYLILGRMRLKRFFVYVVAQYVGSIVGVALLMTMLPSNVEKACAMHIRHGINPGQALIMESVTTMILMLAVAGATDPVNEKVQKSLSIRMGFIVFGLVLSIDPFTACGKNPSRSLAPSLLYNSWHHYWLYEVGPYFGAALGAVLYRFVFNGNEKYSLNSALVRVHCM